MTDLKELGYDRLAIEDLRRMKDHGVSAAFIRELRELGYNNLPIEQLVRLKDHGVNAGIPAYEAALKANNKKYEVFVYDGTQHGFHNDTTPRYDEAAAKLAWTRTLDFFNKNLR